MEIYDPSISFGPTLSLDAGAAPTRDWAMTSSRTAVLAGIAAAASMATAAQAEPLLLGVFAGDLACASCTAVRTELTLVRKDSGWAEGRYLLKQTSLGTKARPRVTSGEWTTLRGDAVDDDAVVYELDPNTPTLHFVEDGGGRIRALDKDLKAWPKRMAAILTRQTANLPSPSAVNCLRKGGLPDGPACAKAPASH